MTDLQFDAERHEYRVDGRVVPHVTGVLRAALGDQFARVPPDVLERKRQIGQAAHVARDLDDRGELDDASVHPLVMPYVDAWRAFRREFRFHVIASEQRLYSPSLDLAGAVDLLVSIDCDDREQLGVVDLKTGLPGPLAALQTAAYELLARSCAAPIFPEDFAETVRRFAMQALPNGRYRLTEYTSPADARDFRSCLNVARILERLAA